jgi:hypothetical protein
MEGWGLLEVKNENSFWIMNFKDKRNMYSFRSEILGIAIQ